MYAVLFALRHVNTQLHFIRFTLAIINYESSLMNII